MKFDIANFVETENLLFTMYPKICELEAHHGVHIGYSYIIENDEKEMIHYNADLGRQGIMRRLANGKICFFTCRWVNRHGDIDNEVILAVWCDQDRSDEKVHT